MSQGSEALSPSARAPPPSELCFASSALYILSRIWPDVAVLFVFLRYTYAIHVTANTNTHQRLNTLMPSTMKQSF